MHLSRYVEAPCQLADHWQALQAWASVTAPLSECADRDRAWLAWSRALADPAENFSCGLRPRCSGGLLCSE